MAALVVSHLVPKTRHRLLAIAVALLAAAANYVFYRVAVVPMYRANGFSQAAIAFSLTWQTIRWGVLALVMCRLTVRLQESGATSGFVILRSPSRLPHALAFGVAAGAVAAAAMYALSFVEHRVGFLSALPWPIANGQPVDVRFAIGGGLRNLVGEEIFARLGAQSIAFYFLRRFRRGAVLAVFVSSLAFEIWHNPLKIPQFLNFTGSCFFGHRPGVDLPDPSANNGLHVDPSAFWRLSMRCDVAPAQSWNNPYPGFGSRVGICHSSPFFVSLAWPRVCPTDGTLAHKNGAHTVVGRHCQELDDRTLPDCRRGLAALRAGCSRASRRSNLVLCVQQSDGKSPSRHLVEGDLEGEGWGLGNVASSRKPSRIWGSCHQVLQPGRVRGRVERAATVGHGVVDSPTSMLRWSLANNLRTFGAEYRPKSGVKTQEKAKQANKIRLVEQSAGPRFKSGPRLHPLWVRPGHMGNTTYLRHR